MKKIVVLILLSFSLFTNAQEDNCQSIEVLTLGVFHFNFPNLDVEQIKASDQINVLEEKYQNEIRQIVEKLAKFKPTIIVIEDQPENQAMTDSLYNLYLQGKYELDRQEEEQIGYRLAKKMGLKTLYCVDEWGDFDARIEKLVSGNDTLEYNKFVNYFENSIVPNATPERLYKTEGILAEFKQLNNPENIKKSLGTYLTEPFRYESQKNDFMGVKFETGRWFSRNLKIFRNIQRIPVSPDDKILVIFGASHLNLLNIFFDSSPDFKLVRTNDFLE